MNMRSKLGAFVESIWEYASYWGTLGEQQGLKGSFWGSWGNLTPEHLKALSTSGCQEVIWNTNDTKRTKAQPFKWMQPRDKFLDRAQMTVDAGMTVAPMVWCWADVEFMQQAGEEVARLRDRLGPKNMRMVQLDWEGHAETSARKVAGVSTRKGERQLTQAERDAIAGAVDDGLQAFVRQLPTDITLGITPLYFRRAGGDAAIKWHWHSTASGRVWSIDELLIQAYSIWDTDNKDTLKDNYQPPVLQQRAFDNYAPLEPWLSEVGIGINGWKLKRPSMTAVEAMDAAVEGVLSTGAERIAIWAGHLMDGDSNIDQNRFDLACAAYRRACLGQQRVTGADEHVNAQVFWSRKWVDSNIARGGVPKGYALPGQMGLKSKVASFIPIVKQIRAKLIAERAPLGTCVPFVHKSRDCVVCLQHHPWTIKNGKRVYGKFKGATLFFRLKPGVVGTS